MKNKYVYILALTILGIILSLYFLISYFNKNFDIRGGIVETSSGEILKNDIKNINSLMDSINSNNYVSVNEFLGYFNTGSGINLNVNLLEEDFYIKMNNGSGSIITKFDKKFISEIDNSGDKNIKNQVILDIFNSYKKNNFILGEPNENRSGVRLLKEYELPFNMQFHNNLLLPYNGESSLESTIRLESKKNKTIEDEQQLSYLYDFAGDYKKSLSLKEKTGIEKISYKIEGRVFNLGNALKGAKVEVLNYDNISTFTDENGKYSLNFETYPLSRLRLRASFDKLSDGYNGVYVVFDYNNQYSENINFSLHVSDTNELVKASDLSDGKTKIVKSTLGNSFEFKKGVIIDKNNKVFNGDFNVEIFEFNRNTPGMENFLKLDNFDNVYGYTGNMMITNGMTYLLITDLNGNELFISKKNPIITRQKVDIDYLLTHNQNGTNILSDGELNLILEKSKEDGYYIDNKFLGENGITGFSPWWVLNRTKGIWENNPIKLLNKSGLKESFYYNVN